MGRVLAARVLLDGDSIRRFCDPKLTDLHEPGLLPGLEAAAARIVEAVRGGQKIVIYGDYDVDGIAATAILFHVIKAAAPGADVTSYVPHRLEEGYGLNEQALRTLRSEGADLVVTVDCGVCAHEPARAAASIGLDLVITDHHDAMEHELPQAAAVVHPRLNGGTYPFGDLCGAGVAFKLAWGFAVNWCGSRRVARNIQEVLLNVLPLAALGTIADVVPLAGENRTLAAWGLRLIKQTPLPGLRALLEVSNLMQEDVDSEKVGFILAPRLNACGRMGHAAEAVRLLTDAPPNEVVSIARNLVRLNRERQQTEQRITEHAAGLAEDAGMTADDRRVIVLADDSWHAGVVGIACSRLVERYCRPVVLLHRNGDLCRGSARSIEGYSIHEALGAASGHLLTWGGHAAAAGLTLHSSELAAFTEALTAHANAGIAPESLVPTLWIDCDAAAGELDVESVGRLASLSPFGQANPRPAVRLSGLELASAPRQMGGNGRHLALTLRSSDDRWMRAVWFGEGARAADLVAGMRLDAVVEPKINTWNGRSTVEGIVRDVRVTAPGAFSRGEGRPRETSAACREKRLPEPLQPRRVQHDPQAHRVVLVERAKLVRIEIEHTPGALR